jgi:hypothetical protein
VSRIKKVGLISLSLSVSGCAIMPDLPPDWALPMQEILLHTACELQDALRDVKGRIDPKQFDAAGWNIKVTLNPKVDADIQPGVGMTRRQLKPTSRFSNFVIGGGNGATMEMKGNRTGSVDFKFDSEALINDKSLPCDSATPSYHSLTKQLAIREWLLRAVEAMSVTGSRIDSPSFSADVFIKFNGTASWTYTLPPGTDLVTLGGFYQLDENLSINFTARSKTVHVVTLPVGGPGRSDPNHARPLIFTATTVFEDQAASLQQIRQQLQNIKTVTQ